MAQGCLWWRFEIDDVLSRLERVLAGYGLAAVKGRGVLAAAWGAVEAGSVGLRGASGGEPEHMRARRLILTCVSKHLTWTFTSHLLARAGGAGAGLILLRSRVNRHAPAVHVRFALDVTLRAQQQLHAYLPGLLLVGLEPLQGFVPVDRRFMGEAGSQPHRGRASLRRLEGVRLSRPATGVLGLRLGDQGALQR